MDHQTTQLKMMEISYGHHFQLFFHDWKQVGVVIWSQPQVDLPGIAPQVTSVCLYFSAQKSTSIFYIQLGYLRVLRPPPTGFDELANFSPPWPLNGKMGWTMEGWQVVLCFTLISSVRQLQNKNKE